MFFTCPVTMFFISVLEYIVSYVCSKVPRHLLNKPHLILIYTDKYHLMPAKTSVNRTVSEDLRTQIKTKLHTKYTNKRFLHLGFLLAIFKTSKVIKAKRLGFNPLYHYLAECEDAQCITKLTFSLLLSQDCFSLFQIIFPFSFHITCNQRGHCPG